MTVTISRQVCVKCVGYGHLPLDISPPDISPRTPPPRTFSPTSLSRTFPRHYRKTLPPNVFKFGPLPDAHITSESHCHWHITCKIDWKIHALQKKSLYTAQLSTPNHRRIRTKNSYASMSHWRWSYQRTYRRVLLLFHFELPRDFSCGGSCRMRCAFVSTVFLVSFTETACRSSCVRAKLYCIHA